MRFASLICRRVQWVALGLTAILCTSASAQQLPDYSKPKSHLFNFVAPYTPRHVPAPNFANTPRIDQLLRDGKIMLSIDDAIALALENNLDIAIQRYNLSIADTDVLRTKAGSSTRGVNTGLVQGTPGGGVGSIGAGGVGSTAQGAGAGGTTTGTGGAGAGTAGIVSSTLGSVGGPIDNYDPFLSSTLSLEHGTFPLGNVITTGTSTFQQNTGTANFSYQQGWASGTLLNIGYQNNRQTTNSSFNAVNPAINSSYRLQFRQHLLQGLSLTSNMRFIKIAKNNREISDVAFRNQVLNSVAQIENIYWDLVSAYDAVLVQERSLALANKTLSDNRKQVEIGTLAPIEIVRAESVVATANQSLIVSQTNLQLQQLLMKNAISRNIIDNPLLAEAQVVPTDRLQLPATEPVVPTQDLINEALQHRPDLSQSQIDLTNRDINNKAARNELLPTVDLVTWYGTSALKGDQNAALNCSANATTFVACPPTLVKRGGFGNAFATLFGNDFPDYGVGFNVTIPIRNRTAQADQVRSELEYRQAQMALQQLKNQISIQVRNAQFAVQQNRAQVDAAIKGRELAQQSLDAEQKKYALGASTNTLVLQAQRDLSQSESAVVSAMAAYEKSRVQLDLVTGTLLTKNGISISDAETGSVKAMPHVPGAAPRQTQEPNPQMAPPSQTNPQPAPQPQNPPPGL